VITSINPFELWTFVFTIIGVLAFIFVPYIRKVAEWFVTIIHEVGHGVFSLITGGGIRGISLHKDGSGATNTTHRVGLFTWLTRTVVLFAGYATPIYLGVFMLFMTANGNAQAMFYVLVGIGVLTLIFIRNFFGIVIMFLYFAALGAGILLQQGAFIPVFVVFFGMLFVLRGIYDLIIAGYLVFFIGRNDPNFQRSDFHILSDESFFRIPEQAWYIIYILLNAVAVFFVFLFFA
jgi:hypothetical protein